jgi:hypothetical protein
MGCFMKRVQRTRSLLVDKGRQKGPSLAIKRTPNKKLRTLPRSLHFYEPLPAPRHTHKMKSRGKISTFKIRRLRAWNALRTGFPVARLWRPSEVKFLHTCIWIWTGYHSTKKVVKCARKCAKKMRININGPLLTLSVFDFAFFADFPYLSFI